jgi:hypothetical protein
MTPKAISRILTAAALLSKLASAQNQCDVTNDGTLNGADLNSIVSMALGLSPCDPSNQSIGGCNVIGAQRVVNAAAGGGCSTSAAIKTHSVTLSWTASVSANVIGYNLYRSTTPGSNYTQVNSALISGTSYTDSVVQAGQTYYYAATAIDSSQNESGYSTEVNAIVPNP